MQKLCSGISLFLPLSWYEVQIHVENLNTDNIVGLSLPRYEVKIYVPKHITQKIYSGICDFVPSLVTKNKFMHRTLILTIYSGFSLFRYDLKIIKLNN